MPRSASGQTFIVTCDASNGTVDHDPATPKGPNAILKFKLKDPSKYRWGSPAITITNGGTVFGSVSAPGGDSAVTVTDQNADNVLYTYSFNAVLKSTGQAVAIDPGIQNSDSN
jgi:hypothetical protein